MWVLCLHDPSSSVPLLLMILQVQLQHQSNSLTIITIGFTLPRSVAPGDYAALNGFELAFNIGDDRVCHNVTISDDNECEQPAESFLSQLSYISGEMPIIINPEEARVFIDDTNESECTGRYTCCISLTINRKLIKTCHTFYIQDMNENF